MRFTPLLFAVAACGDDGAALMPDAPGPMPDAESPHCPDPPAFPADSGRHIVYVNTEGVTLTKGDCSNATTNCTLLIKDATVTVPQFLPNTAGREQFIADILRLARVRLAPYSIDLVTERPASGSYYMSVFGGDPATIVGIPNIAANAPGVCIPDNPNHIDLIFDRHFQGGPEGYATTLLSDLGAMYGLMVTDTRGDCMCRVNGCDFQGVCTFSPNIALAPNGLDCGRGPTQDEQALLKTAAGCR